MLPTLPEDRQLENVEELLARRFGDRVPHEMVHAEVQSLYAGFRKARIRTYVPVLVQRQAALNLIAYGLSGGGAAVHEAGRAADS
jgi:hypothetical protein